MSNQITQLKDKLQSNLSDKEKTDVLNELATELKFINPKEALDFAKEALLLAIEIDYLRGIAYARLYLAINRFFLSKVEKILENLLEALDYFKNHPEEPGYAIALNYTGNVYESYGQYEKAMEYGQASLKTAEKYDRKETIGDARSTIGIIYSRLSDYDKAIDSFKQALKIREELKNEKAVASSINWIARTYTLAKNYSEALKYYQKSIELRKKTKNPALPWSYLGIASLYEQMNEQAKAIEYYSLSLALNEQNDEKRCNLHCYLGLGKVHTANDNTAKASEYLKTALNIAESLKAKPIIYEIYLLLAENAEKDRNLEVALKYYRLHQQSKEEVLNSEMLNKLKYQQINYETEKSRQEAEIYQLRNVELKQAFEQIERKNREITDSIEYASRIQNALLPLKSRMDELLDDYFVLFKPRNIVSGDFYWVKKVNDYIIFVAADCTGHGVPGAFMSMLGIAFLNEIVNKREITQTNQVLNELRIQVKEALKQTGKKGELYDGMDISICALNTKKNILQYAGAMNSLYLVREGELRQVAADRMPIAYYQKEKPSFTNHELQLKKGDAFYIFSDGFVDQFGGKKGFKYKTSNFQKKLMEIHLEPMCMQKELLEKELSEWMTGWEQTDDILVVGVRV